MKTSDRCPFCETGDVLPMWKSASFIMRFCRACGLHWADGPTEMRLPSYNRDYYERNYLGTGSGTQKAFFNNQLQIISPRVPGHRLLDVGFGAGFFLEEAQNHGWQVSGIETSDDALREVQSRLGDRAHLIRGDFLTAEFRPGDFDLICFWDVLAHVSDPRAYLVRARQLLKTKGLLVIKTPMRSNALFHTLKYFPAWIRESLIHWPWQRYYFSSSGLSYVLGQLEYSGVEITSVSEPDVEPKPWHFFWRHPKGALLTILHWICNRVFAIHSCVIHVRPSEKV